MWFQRDQFTNEQVPFSDSQMIQAQHDLRTANHSHSARWKAPLAPTAPNAQVEVGELVNLYSDRSKTHARNRYLVSALDDPLCNIRKFVGSQLRNTSYRIKRAECFKVPCHPEPSSAPLWDRSDYDDQPDQGPAPQPPAPPPLIPFELSMPATPPAVCHRDGTSDDPPSTVSPSNFPDSPSQDSSPVLCQSPASVSHHVPCSRSDNSASTPPQTPPAAASEVITPLLTQRHSTRQRKLPDHFKDYVMD